MIHLSASAQRILIVSEVSQDVVSLIAPLRDAGCWVELATKEEDAVRLAATLNPTLVLVGDSDNESTSIGLTMRIRSSVPHGSMPLFIVAPSCDAVCGQLDDPENLMAENSMAGLIDQISQIVVDRPTAHGHPAEAALLAASQVCAHGIRLDRIRYRVWIDSTEIRLTPMEFRLLWDLASNPGYVRSRQQLTRGVKGSSQAAQARTIDAHVKSIRRKLGDRSDVIETVHGVGYRFRDDDR